MLVGETGSGAPSLIGTTYSYWLYWDGRFASLEEVLEHYNNPPLGRHGQQELNLLDLSSEQIEQVAAFLGTLAGPAPRARQSATQ